MKDFGTDRPWIPEEVEKLIVEEGITHVSSNLCRNSRNLISVTLPSTLKSIGHDAFNSCRTLSDIHIPFGVEEIGDRAFYNCKAFIELDMPVSMKKIGKEAFANCSNITTARLTTGIESIGDKAFDKCLILANLSGLPDYVTIDSFSNYGLNRAAV